MKAPLGPRWALFPVVALLALSACQTPSPSADGPRLITAPATTALTPAQWRLRARRSGWPAVAIRPLGRWRGRAIPAKLFNERMARESARARVTRARIRQLWSAAIEQFILDIELETRSISIDLSAVHLELEQARASIGVATLQDLAAAHGVPLAALKQRVRRAHRLRKLWRALTPEPSDELVRHHLRTQAAKYRVRETVQVRHIFLRHTGDEAQDRLKAAGLVTLARAPGADFAALATRHSQGPSGLKGGDVGALPRGRMLRQLERWAFSAKPGDISDPIRTDVGWHILELLAHTPGRDPSFERDADRARDVLRAQSIAHARRTFLDAQRRSPALEEDKSALELVDVP